MMTDRRTCTVCDNGDGHHHQVGRPLALEPLNAADWLEVLEVERERMRRLHAIVERARLRKIHREFSEQADRRSTNIKAALARRGQGSP